MHNISNLFYFGTTLYMFRSKQQAATEPVWHIPDDVCTVSDSWWWTERLSETCRVLFQNKINLRYCASGWFYYRNILRCTVLRTSTQIHGYLTSALNRCEWSVSGPGRLNTLNPELNPICYLLALLGAHHFLHVSRIRVKLLTFKRLMSYIYGALILDVSRSHTTTQHSR